MLTHVVFLDRDGVINRDSPDYIKRWDEFEFLPGSREAIASLTARGATCIVITNQSGVNRGLIPRSALDDIHRRMRDAIRAAGGLISDIFYCPHTPAEQCACRKPRPGLIDRACRKYAIDLATAVMVGDRARDIACGRNAGCGLTLLVTGGPGPGPAAADGTVASLAEGVAWILSRWGEQP
jgi:D-glycero-D-manno-heptose 1,7-bisphosphate phosphatase